jgi:hypothetical protein
VNAYEAVDVVAPRILNLGTVRTYMVTSTLRPLYPRGGYRSTCSLQGQLGPRDGLDSAQEKRLLFLPEIERRFLGRPARIVASLPTELARLRHN